MRSRASSTMMFSPKSFSACAAPRPAAPAPMMATSTEEGRGIGSPACLVMPGRVPGPLRHRFPRLFRALAVVGIQELLAQADRFRRHLDQFVVLDIGERLFQRHP